MEYKEKFILQKKVDWSLLNYGFAIPMSVWGIFGLINPDILTHGISKQIKIIIGTEMFDAKLVNQNFDKNKFPDHKDLIQIRYSVRSPIALKLKSLFQKSYDYFYTERLLMANQRKQINLPDDIHENIRFFFTDNPDVFCLECITEEDFSQVANALHAIPEEVYESISDDTFFLQDKSASIQERERLMKYRRLDRSIIKTLKEHYNYCDQITGEKIGSLYGDSVVEAHHIDYFTISQNNDSTNIIIISPNYHRIIHKNNPIFNRKTLQFEFPNGEVLKLKLYDHLLAKLK